jgi:hypothetical protein
MTDWPDAVPDVCTLPTAERPLRLAEFDDLFATAVRRVEKRGPVAVRLTLVGPDSLEATVRDLTVRETVCCSFFAFTVTAERPGHVVLDIGVPAAQGPVLAALADRAVRLAA